MVKDRPFHIEDVIWQMSVPKPQRKTVFTSSSQALYYLCAVVRGGSKRKETDNVETTAINYKKHATWNNDGPRLKKWQGLNTPN